MHRQGSPEDWAKFHELLGRYITAAGNAESMMYRLLLLMRSQAGLPTLENAPMWGGLLRILRADAAGGPWEEEMTYLLRSADRRGRLRNSIVHTGWFAVGPDGYVGRRHSAHDDGSMFMTMSRDVLETDIEIMEQFENDLESFGQRVQSERRL
ncbi:hypothetical protein CLV49_3277 [Labedella gwakjiensis]|uniref:Uncharacterized protein n=1 Tax=Labedella gwakjiensis TaxID=390269 RepID=A0A2P8H097_9MICO|nr:hypothetical protein [Labedella gwakjiensis]PSL39633.1 hypothetical protein CLV49_3277 [Labedella gwakjiensis]RUQ85978.1 hypothetical protein ELQ93_02875 [Labedella gwakjiensis]